MKKIICLALTCVSIAFQAQKKKPNVLFIAVDDLKTELGCYGSDIVKSPNIDRLAKEGIVFRRAYCQQAICGPSRASIMTGARPESINVTDLFQDFRANVPSIKTIPQHFRENGYETAYTGKVFHGKYNDKELSWSKKINKVPRDKKSLKTMGGYALAESQLMWLKNKMELEEKYGEKTIRENWLDKGPVTECADVPDDTYEDGYNTSLAIGALKELVQEEKPWFLGLGFKKPHLDFIAPKKYWDLYDRESIPLATNTERPKNGAAMGLSESLEVRVAPDVPKTGAFSPELQRKLRHGYYACISYIDAQLGRMIAALKETGQYENTIIVFWSDHGFNLGEMGYWGKANNYEVATRVPFIISAPEFSKKVKGQTSDALVELVDVFPTLCDLAGLEKPNHLEGTSLVPLLKKPNKKWKEAAYSLFPSPALREWAAIPFTPPFRKTFFEPLIDKIEKRIALQMGDKWNRKTFEDFVMGYAMRTDRYRIVVWKDRRKPEDQPLFVELYDHKTDVNETENIAENNPVIVAKLIQQLKKAGWQGK
ncbi:sulfatase [Ochrovirga pacifica]|uniref:sulfatase n=1 Tax=Ochrovirga pacifica TaxID=1042376 RepID=UPI000255A4F9|nr:sulfatase [Ochrovirga pacifica]